MAGLQGIGQGGQNFGVGNCGGVDALGQGQNTQLDAQKLLQKLAEMLGIDPQSGDKASSQGCQGGGKAQGASGAGGAGGGEAGDLEDLLKKLRELAQKDPGALMQALGQMPGLAQALSGAMLGAGGGASGAGMVGN